MTSPRQPATLHALHDAAISRRIRHDRRIRLKLGLGTPTTSTPAETAEAIADALVIHDLSAYEPAEEGNRYLKCTNLADALSDVMITPDGTLNWDYRPYASTPSDPATTTAIILAILNPDHTPARPLPATPGTTLNDLLTRTAPAHGIRTSTLPATDVTAECPARPCRGWVLAADTGAIWWTCPIAGQPPGTDGLNPDQIAATIARALAISGATRTPTPPAIRSPATNIATKPGPVYRTYSSRCDTVP
jgi:hypothetical protein